MSIEHIWQCVQNAISTSQCVNVMLNCMCTFMCMRTIMPIHYYRCANLNCYFSNSNCYFQLKNFKKLSTKIKEQHVCYSI